MEGYDWEVIGLELERERERGSIGSLTDDWEVLQDWKQRRRERGRRGAGLVGRFKSSKRS